MRWPRFRYRVPPIGNPTVTTWCGDPWCPVSPGLAHWHRGWRGRRVVWMTWADDARSPEDPR